MAEEHKKEPNNVEPGMDVDVTKGDLGEKDISKPKVSGVERDEHGNVKQVSVIKGLVFKKKLDIPADRIEEVVTHRVSQFRDAEENLYHHESCFRGIPRYRFFLASGLGAGAGTHVRSAGAIQFHRRQRGRRVIGRNHLAI